MERSVGNISLKNPVTAPGIHPGTVSLVAQGLNHYATPGPYLHLIPSLKIEGTTRPLLHTSSWNAERRNYENLIAHDTSALRASL